MLWLFVMESLKADLYSRMHSGDALVAHLVERIPYTWETWV